MTGSARPEFFAWGIDPGASCGVALVSFDPAGALSCRVAHHCTGARWREKLRDQLATAEAPVYIERPADKVRAVHARHHLSMLGLGRRIGLAEGVALDLDRPVHLVTTREWWASLPVRLTGKRENGEHRIGEAAGLVATTAAWLDAVPLSSRVDVAEAILIAAAGCYMERSRAASPAR